LTSSREDLVSLSPFSSRIIVGMAEDVAASDKVHVFERWKRFMGTKDGRTAIFIVFGVLSLMLLQLFLAICQYYYRRTLNRNLEMRGLLDVPSSRERTEILDSSREERPRIPSMVD
ncbi:hypothetical protein PMAYCL1PPCAC_18642, partial [Pristionchus mayeri]